MRVNEWFGDWIIDHRARHPHTGLPDPESPEGVILYQAWRKVFVKRGVSDLDVATEASERMVAEPPRFPKDHLPKLLDLAVAVYRDRNAAGQGNPECDREAAVSASAGCVHCGGQGLAIVYHPRPSRSDRIPADVAAYCVCAMGKWIAANHKQFAVDVYRRTPNLSEVLEGRSVWLAEPPAAVQVPEPEGAF